MSSAADKARVAACQRQVCRYFTATSKEVRPALIKLATSKPETLELYDKMIECLKSETLGTELCFTATTLNKIAWDFAKKSGSADDKTFWLDLVAASHTVIACVLINEGPAGCLKAMKHIDTVLILRGYMGPLRGMCGFAEPKAKTYAKSLRMGVAPLDMNLQNLSVCDATATKSINDNHALSDACHTATVVHNSRLEYPEPPKCVMPALMSGEKVKNTLLTDEKYDDSFREFKSHVKRGEPLVLTGGQVGWSASAKWMDLESLIESLGHRWIPVELGTYGTTSWREEIIQMEAFIEEFIRPSHQRTLLAEATPIDSVGYVAQHELFDHFPTMKLDFKVPQIIKDLIKGHPEKMNGWFGTAGTVTPLHTDTYENILAQVVGYKYLRLYLPDQTPKLYNNGPQGTNISQVCCEKEDLVHQPLVKDAKYYELILRPGDMLYIPVGTWHYVRSLTPSFSINFWW